MGRRYRKRRRQTANKAVDVTQTVVELLNWFKKYRQNARQPGPQLRLAIFPDTGRGLMALTPLVPDDILISIPLRFMITRRNVEDSLKSENCLVIGDLNKLSTHHLIAVFLLLELAKGSDSFWHPYLKTLPDAYSVPYFCSSHEISHLPRYVTEKILKQQKLVAAAYDLTKSHVKIAHDIARFSWAWFAVNTRAVYFENSDDVTVDANFGKSENNLALAPFLDMFNHSSDVTVEVGRANSTEFSEGVYQIRSSNKSYRKYDQIFINYGPHDNLKLCLEYGFVLDQNSNDFVPFSLEELIPNVTDGRLAKAVEFVRGQKFDKNLGAITGPDTVTWNTAACLYVLTHYSRPECWSKIYSLDVENLMRDHSLRAFVFKTFSTKIDEIEASLVVLNDAKTTSESCNVVQRLLNIHRKILVDSLRLLTD